jgi:DNA-directed RNA polymerase subunit RPC12/RpoP
MNYVCMRCWLVVTFYRYKKAVVRGGRCYRCGFNFFAKEKEYWEAYHKIANL